jgi:hypothetical protein
MESFRVNYLKSFATPGISVDFPVAVIAKGCDRFRALFLCQKDHSQIYR